MDRRILSGRTTLRDKGPGLSLAGEEGTVFCSPSPAGKEWPGQAPEERRPPYSRQSEWPTEGASALHPLIVSRAREMPIFSPPSPFTPDA